MPHSKSVAVFLERIILFFSDLTSHVLYLTEAIAPRHDAGKLIRQRRDNISDVWTSLGGNAQTSDTDDSHHSSGSWRTFVGLLSGQSFFYLADSGTNRYLHRIPPSIH